MLYWCKQKPAGSYSSTLAPANGRRGFSATSAVVCFMEIVMQAFVVEVRISACGKSSAQTLRFAVLAKNDAEALNTVSKTLSFGNLARLSTEKLSSAEIVRLELVEGKPRLMGLPPF